MPYDGKLLAQARAALEQRRADNRAEERRRLESVYARAPEIEGLDLRLRRQMTELVKLTVSRPPDLTARLEALKRSNLELQARRAEALTGLGLPLNYLDEIVSCPLCRDKGNTGDGRLCRCMKELYNRELTQELSRLLRRGDESFARFDLKLYDDTPLPGQDIAPRAAMERVFKSCKKFADSFPEVNANLLFQGGTGLGKTYLSACIARTVADKGYSVCYDSASSALEAFETQKFARDTEQGAEAAARVRRMLDCDLMILDDLGTEMNSSVTVSALYTLINDRLTAGKRTVISTNCTDEELQRRYTPAILSRLKGEFLRLPFIGRDIRLKK